MKSRDSCSPESLVHELVSVLSLRTGVIQIVTFEDAPDRQVLGAPGPEVKVLALNAVNRSTPGTPAPPCRTWMTSASRTFPMTRSWDQGARSKTLRKERSAGKNRTGTSRYAKVGGCLSRNEGRSLSMETTKKTMKRIPAAG